MEMEEIIIPDLTSMGEVDRAVCLFPSYLFFSSTAACVGPITSQLFILGASYKLNLLLSLFSQVSFHFNHLPHFLSMKTKTYKHIECALLLLFHCSL